jgi:hypothetical protein
VAADATLISTVVYRRRARRLRCAHAKDPVRLQRSLAIVARAGGQRITTNGGAAVPGAVWSAKPQAAEARGIRAARTFAGMVTERMTGPILPYSQRENLLRAAARMGIGRFEANLIIAAMQHRVRCNETQDETPIVSTRVSPRALFLTGAFVQTMIIVGVRWIAF